MTKKIVKQPVFDFQRKSYERKRENDSAKLKGKMYGDGSTGRIAIAWKPVFQANFQIRRLIFENFQIFF